MWESDERNIIVLSSSQRAYNYATACIQLLLSGGMIFGWPGMYLMMQSEGIYSSYCGETESTMCPARAAVFASIYSGSFTCVCLGYLIAGFTVNKIGGKVGNVVGLSVNTVGLCLMAAANEWNFDVYKLAYCLLGFGGAFLQSTTVHCACLYPENQKLALSVLSGCFSLSSFVFAIMHFIQQSLAISLQRIMLWYAAMHIILMGDVAYTMPFEPFTNFKIVEVGGNLYSRKPTVTDQETFSDITNESPEVINEGVDPAQLGDRLAAIINKGSTRWETIFSMKFVAVCANSWLNFLLLNFWVSSYQELLLMNGDTSLYWSRLSSFLIPFGPVMSPIFGLIMEHLAFHKVQMLISIAQLLLCILSRIRSLPVLMAAVMVYSLNRPMVSTFIYADIERKFGLGKFSFMFGLVAFFTGFATNGSAPFLTKFATEYSHQAVFTGLASACLLGVLICGLRSEDSRSTKSA